MKRVGYSLLVLGLLQGADVRGQTGSVQMLVPDYKTVNITYLFDDTPKGQALPPPQTKGNPVTPATQAPTPTIIPPGGVQAPGVGVGQPIAPGVGQPVPPGHGPPAGPVPSQAAPAAGHGGPLWANQTAFWGRLCAWASYCPRHCAACKCYHCCWYYPPPPLYTYFFCPGGCCQKAPPQPRPYCKEKGCGCNCGGTMPLIAGGPVPPGPPPMASPDQLTHEPQPTAPAAAVPPQTLPAAH